MLVKTGDVLAEHACRHVHNLIACCGMAIHWPQQALEAGSALCCCLPSGLAKQQSAVLCISASPAVNNL